MYCGLSYLFLFLILCYFQTVSEEGRDTDVFVLLSYSSESSDLYLLKLLLVFLETYRFKDLSGKVFRNKYLHGSVIGQVLEGL